MPAPIEYGCRQREERRIIFVAADSVYGFDKLLRAHAVVELPKIRMNDVDTLSCGYRI